MFLFLQKATLLEQNEVYVKEVRFHESDQELYYKPSFLWVYVYVFFLQACHPSPKRAWLIQCATYFALKNKIPSTLVMDEYWSFWGEDLSLILLLSAPLSLASP